MTIINVFENYLQDSIHLMDLNTQDSITNFITYTNAVSISARRYRSSMNIFFSKYYDISFMSIKNFITTHPVKKNTLRQYLRDLKAYAKYLHESDAISKEEFTNINRIKVKGSEQIKKDVLTESEVEQLIAAAPSNYKLIIGLCYYAALRFHEVMQYEDKGDCLLVNGKGGKVMQVGKSEKLNVLLSEYVIEIDTRYRPFLHWLKKTCKDLFDKTITTHCLRTASAVNLYKKTKDIQLTKRHLRHESINTTSRYLNHVTNDDYMDKIKQYY